MVVVLLMLPVMTALAYIVSPALKVVDSVLPSLSFDVLKLLILAVEKLHAAANATSERKIDNLVFTGVS